MLIALSEISLVMSRLPLLLIKISLSAGLVWYAFTKVDVSASLTELRRIPLWAVVAALTLLFAQIVLAALRLRELLALLGARCSVFKAIDIVMIGAFFSQTMVSFVGGDAMRIWRIVRSNISLNLATRGILLDRAAGFVGLIILMILGLPFLLQLVQQPEMRWGLLVAILAGVAGFIVFLSLWRMPDPLKRWRPMKWIAELSSTALTLSRGRKGIAALAGLSLTIQVLNVVILYVITLGLAVQMGFWEALVLVPPVLFISMLPISVAGWGVREGAMVVALNLIGVPAHQSLALSICFGLCMLAISLPGGVLWLVSRSHLTPAPSPKNTLSTSKK